MIFTCDDQNDRLGVGILTIMMKGGCAINEMVDIMVNNG